MRHIRNGNMSYVACVGRVSGRPFEGDAMTHRSTEVAGVTLDLSSGPGPDRPITIGLDHPDATDAALVGAKAAALARAGGAGFDVLPGFVITTAFDGDTDALRDAWQGLSNHGER